MFQRFWCLSSHVSSDAVIATTGNLDRMYPIYSYLKIKNICLKKDYIKRNLGYREVQDWKNTFFHFNISCRPTFLLSKMGSLVSELESLWKLPYRTKIRRTKLSEFWLGVENFVRRKILSVEIFSQCFNT